MKFHCAVLKQVQPSWEWGNAPICCLTGVNIKVVHHRCQAIAFMSNEGSCSSFGFYPIDTKSCVELVHY